MLKSVKSLILCGTFGDTIFYPRLHLFIKYALDVNPLINIQIHTNGSAHDSKWWKKLAKMMKGNKIIFAIDGFEDTHKIHRVGGSFKKVMKNMQTVIDTGCDAIWQFIVFKHNEHQMKEAEQMSKRMGCTSFIIRKSFFYKGKYEKPSMFPNIMSKVEHEISRIGKLKCRMDNNEISTTASGDVIPCCHINYVHYKRLSLNPMNLKDYNLKEIIDSGYLQQFRLEADDKEFCRRCVTIGINTHSIESLILENIKMRRLRKEREQKKEQSNKR
jgi:sulfatase maturation enzyme AslB (radical SAM superfamily)